VRFEDPCLVPISIEKGLVVNPIAILVGGLVISLVFRFWRHLKANTFWNIGGG
jgi:hypothetical protein